MKVSKTLGKISAKLITTLFDENKRIFTIKDTQVILGKSFNEAADILSKLVKRKVVARLKAGKFIIIPQELGSQTDYIGNYYVAGREIINTKKYYIGFYSAMNYWGMLTQPLLKIYIVSSVRQVVPREMKGKMVLVYISKHYDWGIKEEWVTKTEKVKISNMERTIIDALAHPEYCGGVTEVAKGIWLVKEKIDYVKLLNYIKKYAKNIIAKRLGYIIEILDIEKPELMKILKRYVKKRYDIFDTTLPARKINKNKWRLIDNIGKKQIRNLIWH